LPLFWVHFWCFSFFKKGRKIYVDHFQMRNAGKGRLQEEDAPAPDLPDLGASIPQFNLMSSTSNSLIGAAANMPRASQRTISSTASGPGLLRRELSDLKDSANSVSASDLGSSSRTISSESVDSVQDALLKQIGAQADSLENLRIKLLQSFQVADDSLCDNADQVR
jgi:hypothetical protein